MALLAWMAGAFVIAALVAGAAAALAPAGLRQRARERELWLAAIVAAIAIPCLLVMLPAVAPAVVSTTGGPLAPSLPGAGDGELGIFVAGAWGILSLGTLLFLILAHRTTGGRLGPVAPRTLFGNAVWMTDEFGPAVHGFIRPRAVIPAWVLQLPPESQELVIAHEVEHLHRRDQWALLGGLAAAVLMPWNAPLLYAVARLRAAIELDCDQGVVMSHDRRKYSTVLVETSLLSRSARNSPLTSSSFHSALGRRVSAIMAPWNPTRGERVARIMLSGLCLGMAIRYPVPSLAELSFVRDAASRITAVPDSGAHRMAVGSIRPAQPVAGSTPESVAASPRASSIRTPTRVGPGIRPGSRPGPRIAMAALGAPPSIGIALRADSATGPTRIPGPPPVDTRPMTGGARIGSPAGMLRRVPAAGPVRQDSSTTRRP